MIKLVILDRDGVINYESPDYIKSPEEWHPIPGSLEAIAKLNKAQIKVAIATNQSGIGRGLYDVAMLGKIHKKMETLLAVVGGHIDLILFCPHHPDNGCDCRKPRTALIYQIASHFNIDLTKTKVPFIGDSLRDLKAAQISGCKPILVLTGSGEATQKNLPKVLQHISIYPDLSKAVETLLAENSNDHS